MENTEYYNGLYNFLSKTPSGLKSEKGDIVILITNNFLVCSIGNQVREEYKIIEKNITNHSLVIEGLRIDEKSFVGQKNIFKIEKTNKVDALAKPLFNVKYEDSEDYFTLFLINPEKK